LLLISKNINWLVLTGGSLVYTACTSKSSKTAIPTRIPTKTATIIDPTSTATEQPTETPSPTESPLARPTFAFNLNVDGFDNQSAYKLNDVLQLFSHYKLPVVISIPPSINGRILKYHDSIPNICRDFALSNPDLVEFSIFDNHNFLDGSLDQIVSNLAHSQENVAWALWAKYPTGGVPSLYPTSISTQVFSLNNEKINALLQAGIKTGIYSGIWQSKISNIDEGFVVFPSISSSSDQIDIQNLLSKEYSNPEVFSFDLSSVNIESTQHFLNQVNNAKSSDEIDIVKPTNVYFAQGGKQNIIVRLDDLLLGVEQLFFDIIQIVQETTYASSLGVSVIPYDDFNMEENPISYSQVSIDYFTQNPLIEVLVHGVNYENPEFSRSAQEQKEIMVKYTNFLSSVYSQKMEVLVPPLGVITEDTARVMAETRTEKLTDLVVLSSWWPTYEHRLPVGTDMYGNYYPPPLVDIADWGRTDDSGQIMLRPIEDLLIEFGGYNGEPVFCNDLTLNIHPLTIRTPESQDNLRYLLSNLVHPNRRFIGFSEHTGYKAFKSINS